MSKKPTSRQLLKPNHYQMRPVALFADGSDYMELPSFLVNSTAALSLFEKKNSRAATSAPYLPNEIIHHIIKFIPTFHLLAQLRLVNSRFRAIAELILIKHFSAKSLLLETKLDSLKSKYEVVERALAPHLSHYKQFLRNISTQEIVEATWYSTPPSELHTVCACLCMLKKDPSPELILNPQPGQLTDEGLHYFDPTVPALSWTEVKRSMSRYDFKTWLTHLHMNVESIPITNIRKVEQIIQHDPTITYERLREVSLAGYKLLILVAACLQYGSISEEVKVEKSKFVQVETELRGINIFLDFMENPTAPSPKENVKGKQSGSSKRISKVSNYKTKSTSSSSSGTSTPIVRGSRTSMATRVNSTSTSQRSSVASFQTVL